MFVLLLVGVVLHFVTQLLRAQELRWREAKTGCRYLEADLPP